MKIHDLPIFKDELNEIKLAETLGEHVIHMRETLEKHPAKEHIPMLFLRVIERGTFKVENMLIGLANLDENRHEMIFHLGEEIGTKFIPIHAIMVSEAWMSSAPMDGSPYIPPSKNPDRKEVMMFALTTIELKTIGSMNQIDRDADGNIKLGEQLNIGENGGMQSNLLVEFFKGAMSQLQQKA